MYFVFQKHWHEKWKKSFVKNWKAAKLFVLSFFQNFTFLLRVWNILTNQYLYCNKGIGKSLILQCCQFLKVKSEFNFWRFSQMAKLWQHWKPTGHVPHKRWTSIRHTSSWRCKFSNHKKANSAYKLKESFKTIRDVSKHESDIYLRPCKYRV